MTRPVVIQTFTLECFLEGQPRLEERLLGDLSTIFLLPRLDLSLIHKHSTKAHQVSLVILFYNIMSSIAKGTFE